MTMHWKRQKYVIDMTEWMIRCSTLHECKEVLGMSPRTLKRTLRRMGYVTLSMTIERMMKK